MTAADMALTYRKMKRSEWRAFKRGLIICAITIIFVSLLIADAVAFFVYEL
jgi:hypothetical protein